MAPIAQVVIDCDPGYDDALALLAALGTPELQIDFVTTVAGNVSIERATANALSVVDLTGFSQIPVFQGAAAPIAQSPAPTNELYADLALSRRPPPASEREPAGSAATALKQWCTATESLPKIIIAIGPMTNLGILLREDPSILSNISAIYAMGGTLSQQSTRISDSAEFNFYCDPDAVHVVLRSGCPLYLVDYDATTTCQIPVSAISELSAAAGAALAPYIEEWLKHLYEHANRPFGREGIAIHDLYAVACAAGVSPGNWEEVALTIDGSEARRGTLSLIDEPRQSRHQIARNLDADKMVQFMISSFSRLATKRR